MRLMMSKLDILVDDYDIELDQEKEYTAYAFVKGKKSPGGQRADYILFYFDKPTRTDLSDSTPTFSLREDYDVELICLTDAQVAGLNDGKTLAEVGYKKLYIEMKDLKYVYGFPANIDKEHPVVVQIMSGDRQGIILYRCSIEGTQTRSFLPTSLNEMYVEDLYIVH